MIKRLHLITLLLYVSLQANVMPKLQDLENAFDTLATSIEVDNFTIELAVKVEYPEAFSVPENMRDQGTMIALPQKDSLFIFARQELTMSLEGIRLWWLDSMNVILAHETFKDRWLVAMPPTLKNRKLITTFVLRKFGKDFKDVPYLSDMNSGQLITFDTHTIFIYNNEGAKKQLAEISSIKARKIGQEIWMIVKDKKGKEVMREKLLPSTFKPPQEGPVKRIRIGFPPSK